MTACCNVQLSVFTFESFLTLGLAVGELRTIFMQSALLTMIVCCNTPAKHLIRRHHMFPIIILKHNLFIPLYDEKTDVGGFDTEGSWCS